MNVQELKNRREGIGKASVILFSVILVCAILIDLLDYLFHIFRLSDSAFRCILVFPVIFLVYACVFYNSYLSRASQRIDRLLFSEMDPQLLEKELPVFFVMLGNSHSSKSMKHFYEGLKWMVEGNFEEAIKCMEEAKFRRSEVYYAGVQYNKSLLLIRMGMAAEAEIEINTLKKTKIPKLNILYLQSLLHMERGDIAEAKKIYGIHSFSKPIHEMNMRFDRGRLEEVQGNYSGAIAEYQKVASFGLKTWLGQEAARRAQALTDTLSQQTAPIPS